MASRAASRITLTWLANRSAAEQHHRGISASTTWENLAVPWPQLDLEFRRK
jgi:hypothetical protein